MFFQHDKTMSRLIWSLTGYSVTGLSGSITANFHLISKNKTAPDIWQAETPVPVNFDVPGSSLIL